MYVLYLLLCIIFYFLGLIALVFISFKPKYNQVYKRLLPLKAHKKADIHFHFASYGEAIALSELIMYYKNQGFSVLLTCASKTGLAKAKELDLNAFLLPFEPLLYLWLKPAKTLIVFEAELWLVLLRRYKAKKSTTILLNARMKEAKYNIYKKYKWLYSEILKRFDLVLAQSLEDEFFLKKLGAKNTQIFTNIKLTATPKISKKLAKNTEIILIASTHEDEEEIILSRLNKDFLKNKTLIIAPRHPERFLEVEHLLKKLKMDFIKYSDDNNGYLKSSVFLLDTLGELINFYAISDYVILGGSYVEIGGHNFAEPAYFGCKITAGKYIYQQLAMLECIENIKISDEIDFSDVKNAKIKDAFTFNNLCEILNRKIYETR